jgi:hypothetical protein
MRHAMKENKEHNGILPNNINQLLVYKPAKFRPCAEPLAMPKWHIIAIMAAESVSFTELFQKGTVRFMLAAPDRKLASLKGKGLGKTATKKPENCLSTRRDDQKRNAGTIT